MSDQAERRPNPRKNADDAYQAFMSMEESEWQGLLGSLLRGGVLEVEEQKGFDRALGERRKIRDGIKLRLKAVRDSLDELREMLVEEQHTPVLPTHDLNTLLSAEGQLTSILTAHNGPDPFNPSLPAALTASRPIPWNSRGIGLDETPGCFVCSGADRLLKNIAARVKKENETAALACFPQGARMAYFHSDRNTPQIKVGACDVHLPALKHLSEQWFISAERVEMLVRDCQLRDRHREQDQGST